MRISIEKNLGSGKSDSSSAAKKLKINLKIELSISKDDLTHRKYLKLMKNSPFQNQTIFIVDGVKYKCCPIYDLYAASNLSNTGYLWCNVRGSNDAKQKRVHIHRFVW